MVHNADGANDLASHLGLAEPGNVGWVADYKRGARRLFTASYADGSSRLKKNLVYIRVKHVSTAMDGAKATEGLGKAAKTVDGVEEWRVTVLAHRFHVQNALLACFNGGLLQVAIFDLKGDSVAQEVDRLAVQAERLEELAHGHRVKIFVLPSVRVIWVDAVHVLVEIASLLLLEKTHQI